MATFNIEAAREAGYSQKEIQGFIKKNPDLKSFVRRGAEAIVKSPALPIAGAVVGGVAGSGLASVPLAGLGGAGGEAFRQLGARSLGIEAPKTSLEALKKIGIEGALSTLGEGAAQIAFRSAFTLARALKPIGGKIVQTLSAATGVSEIGFQNLLKKPGLIIKATKKKIEKAGKDIGNIIDRLITKELTPQQASIELVERAFKTPGKARVNSKQVALKLAKNEPVSINEVALANREIGTVIRNTTDPAQVALLKAQKNVFRDFLGENVPELLEKNKIFSEIKSVSQFRNIGRLNKAGQPSKLGAMFLALALKNPAILLTSPIIVGGIVSAVGGTAKAISSRLINRPVIQTLLRNNTGSQ